MAAEACLNALTVDLEEYFQVSNFEGVIDRSRWDAIPSRVEAATHRLLDAFDATNSRATFFCLGWVAERNPGLVREIAARGHEIACHGYGHQLVYRLGPQRFREDIQAAKKALEDTIGAELTGYRAPSYSITQASLWALDVLVEEGFRYDSSIFPVRHPRYGIPDFPRQPVRIEGVGGASIMEFPPTTVSMGPLTLPLSGGAYLRFFPKWLFHWGFRRLESEGQALILYVHPWEIDAEQPRQAVSWRVRVNHYHGLAKLEGWLGGLLRAFRFVPAGEVLARLRDAGQLPSHALPATRRAA